MLPSWIPQGAITVFIIIMHQLPTIQNTKTEKSDKNTVNSINSMLKNYISSNLIPVTFTVPSMNHIRII